MAASRRPRRHEPSASDGAQLIAGREARPAARLGHLTVRLFALGAHQQLFPRGGACAMIVTVFVFDFATR
jgi:hypothetical protein